MAAKARDTVVELKDDVEMVTPGSTSSRTQNPGGLIGRLLIMKDRLAYLSTMQYMNPYVEKYFPVDFICSILRGIGNVIFANNPLSGLFFLLAIFINSPWQGVLALFGTASSDLMGRVMCKDKAGVRNGMMGCNASLVGCALAVFLKNSDWGAIPIIGTWILGAMSCIIQLGYISFMKRFNLPVLTLSFNTTVIMALLGTYGLYNSVELSTVELRDKNSFDSNFTFPLLMEGWFNGVSGIFVISNWLSGAFILIGLFVCSPLLASATFAGSMIGSLMGFILGGDFREINNGMWGFNPALACGSVMFFYVPNVRTVILSTAASVLCVLVTGALRTIMSTWKIPAFSLPFCLTAVVILLCSQQMRGMDKVKDSKLSSPEAHYFDKENCVLKEDN